MALQLKPLEGNHIKDFKKSSALLQCPIYWNTCRYCTKKDIGLKINKREKESKSQLLPKGICFCLPPNTLKHTG